MEKSDEKVNHRVSRLERSIEELQARLDRSELVEEALREACCDYEHLIENIPGVVYRGQLDWSVRFFDDKIEELTGYPKEVFHAGKMKWVHLIVPEDLAGVKEETRRALGDRRSYLREYRIKTREGSVKWVQDRGTIRHDRKGGIRHFSGIFFDITERMQAREQILRTQAEMDQIFHTAADGMRLIDTRFNVLKANETFLNMFMLDEKSGARKCFETLIGSECHTPRCSLRRILQGEDRIEMEVTRYRSDGSPLHCILTATAFRDPNGRLLGIVEDFKDITERKEIEQHLARSEAKYRLLVETIPCILFKGYPDWCVEFVDDKIEELTGYSKDDFNSRSLRWCDIIHPDDLDATKAPLKEALSKDKIYVREYRIVTKTGKIVWGQERSRAVVDETGQLAYVSGTFFDISDKVQMQQELENALAELEQTNDMLQARCREINELNAQLEQRVEEGIRELVESERKYQRLFQNSKDGVYICDARGRISDINPSGLQLLGYSRNDGTLVLYDLFCDRNAAGKYHRMLESQGFVTDYEVDLKRRDGSILNVLLTASAIRDEAGNLIGSEGIAKDLTQLHKATEALVQSQKMATIGRLAAGVAHEINTPLMIILANAQLLADDFDEDSEAYRGLKIIADQTKICGRIVAALLEFSRQKESHPTKVDINRSIEEVIAVLEHSLMLERIQIIRSFDPDIPPVLADKEKLKQIYINLINNAHHAIGSDGTIAVSTRFDSAQNAVTLKFMDSGPGIPPEIRNRIFDPFFTTKGVGQGVGLGLSVVFGIVKEHRGKCEVISPLSEQERRVLAEEGAVDPGPGTAFVIHLPVSP